MMQELFGGSNVGIIGGGDRSKLSNTPANCGGIIYDGGSSSSPSSSSAAAAAAAAAAESLRCPRCDSPNTKFCYYNNYNLTQPRHFCKTCRRYWTKGGALRNVPIGGGCRKNKSATIAAAIGKSGSAAAKLKTLSSEMVKTGLFSTGFDHEPLPSNPILWAPSQNSHILSLLRANQNHHYDNPSHLTNSASLKEEGLLSSFGSSINARVMVLDPLDPTHLPSVGFSNNSSYRNQTTDQLTQGIFGHGSADDHHQNHGSFQLQELYQRFRSTNYNYPDQNGPVILGHVASANTSMNSSAILESAPVAAGELGFWNYNNNHNHNNNPTLSWPIDLPTTTTNGGYP